MNLCRVNEDHLRCNVPRKAVKACPGRGWLSLWSSRPLSHLESGHAVPFSPQDFCSPCEFVHCCHNTQILQVGIRIISPLLASHQFKVFSLGCFRSLAKLNLFCLIVFQQATPDSSPSQCMHSPLGIAVLSLPRHLLLGGAVGLTDLLYPTKTLGDKFVSKALPV